MSAEIEVKWEKNKIAAFQLHPAMLLPVKSKQPIHLATRAKLPSPPPDQPIAEGTFEASITIINGDYKPALKTETAKLSFANGSNAINTEQLVLSVQSIKSILREENLLSIKAVVPRPQLKRVLKEVSASVADPANLGSATAILTMTVFDPAAGSTIPLSDEVFLSFNVASSQPKVLQMQWAYNTGSSLTATALLSPQAGT